MHNIDLNKKIDRCDLINEINNDYNKSFKEKNGIKIEKIILDKRMAKKINKKEGKYISIIFNDVTDFDNRESLIDVLTDELKLFLKEKNLLGSESMIVGLGNSMSTPDSLGPKTIDKIISTRHLFEIGDVDKRYSPVSKIAPGVFATTGIETFNIIKGLVKEIKPKFLIVIDSLCASNINNINKVIQITDSGIEPGSGVGNERREISKEKLGIDVIALGIPTVVNLHTIVKDFLSDYDIDEILSRKGNNFMVTPKEIDFIIEKLSYVLSKSINNSLHNLTK